MPRDIVSLRTRVALFAALTMGCSDATQGTEERDDMSAAVESDDMSAAVESDDMSAAVESDDNDETPAAVESDNKASAERPRENEAEESDSTDEVRDGDQSAESGPVASQNDSTPSTAGDQVETVTTSDADDQAEQSSASTELPLDTPMNAAASSFLSVSPGTVRFELDFEEAAFCDPFPWCVTPGHLSISTTDSQLLVPFTQPDGCAPVPCDACQSQQQCSGANCLTGPPEGTETLAQAFTWDGAIYETGTCDDGSSCRNVVYAPAGRYLAQLCGNASHFEDCQLGERICIEFEFEFPSDEVYIEQLTAP